jgi:L-threonylcarbamoyladenylate synthase
MASIQQTPVDAQYRTRALRVDTLKIGQFHFQDPRLLFLGDWKIDLSETTPDADHLQEAASLLRSNHVPVAFPTETVYGLGADATRSAAVQGIYRAKQRPSDNPLIVHISSLSQLRNLLSTSPSSRASSVSDEDPIPKIYHALISRFWPGPLTILLALPTPSPLAPEVTASLSTFAVRMPSSRLALALIHLAGVPVAAPSANVSSKPSPTTAAHVLHDLNGRIELVLDGGACDVGLESTVVDGLTSPPVILRPGGISIDTLRQCPGWEDVRVGYTDGAESKVPRAPGMKYKHYSPAARVLLFHGQMDSSSALQYLGDKRKLGIVTTKRWKADFLKTSGRRDESNGTPEINGHSSDDYQRSPPTEGAKYPSRGIMETTPSPVSFSIPSTQHSRIGHDKSEEHDITQVWVIPLGTNTADIARGLFSALRELDMKGVDVIFVEGVDDSEGGAGAAIMNRLRKAADAEIIL